MLQTVGFEELEPVGHVVRAVPRVKERRPTRDPDAYQYNQRDGQDGPRRSPRHAGPRHACGHGDGRDDDTQPEQRKRVPGPMRGPAEARHYAQWQRAAGGGGHELHRPRRRRGQSRVGRRGRSQGTLPKRDSVHQLGHASLAESHVRAGRIVPMQRELRERVCRQGLTDLERLLRHSGPVPGPVAVDRGRVDGEPYPVRNPVCRAHPLQRPPVVGITEAQVDPDLPLEYPRCQEYPKHRGEQGHSDQKPRPVRRPARDRREPLRHRPAWPT